MDRVNRPLKCQQFPSNRSVKGYAFPNSADYKRPSPGKTQIDGLIPDMWQ